MPAKEEIMEALKNVNDPELMMHIVDLGLVYGIEIDEEEKSVVVKATLTSPGCPLSHIIEADIKRYVGKLDGVSLVEVELVWEPPWTPAMMSEEAKLTLGYDI
jgi:metal-sulfur cluster biosynthetic enzyme